MKLYKYATIEENYIRPPAYWIATIKFGKPLDLEKIKQNQSVEGGEKQSLSIKTEFGAILVQSKWCIQCQFVKTPEDMKMLYNFLEDLLYNNEMRKWTDWLKDKLKKDAGELLEDIHEIRRDYIKVKKKIGIE